MEKTNFKIFKITDLSNGKCYIDFTKVELEKKLKHLEDNYNYKNGKYNIVFEILKNNNYKIEELQQQSSRNRATTAIRNLIKADENCLNTLGEDKSKPKNEKQKKYFSEYYIKNKEKYKNYYVKKQKPSQDETDKPISVEKDAKTKEAFNEYHRKYRQNHLEKIRQYNRQYKLKRNSEKI